MKYPPEQATVFIDAAQKIIQSDAGPDVKLRELWKSLITLHSMALNYMLKCLTGGRVLSGPFKGMALLSEGIEQHSGAVLLGCYEKELHNAIERIIAEPYQQILNIGCSFGYYSVGLAMRMPTTAINAYDIDPAAREKCKAAAALNGVGDRIKISGEFRGEDFAAYTIKKTLALVDIEGAEMHLLDPARYPALRKMDLIVELHDCYDPSISKTILERFSPSHDIEFIQNKTSMFPFEDYLDPSVKIDPFDNLLLTSELREGPTPWAVMRTKSI